jgi:hypothetical protein
MPIDYEDFVLRLTSIEEGRLLITVAGATETRDLTVLKSLGRVKPQLIDGGGDKRPGSSSPPSAEEAGQALYDYLFQGAIGACCERRLGHLAARPGAGLRLVLSFDPQDPAIELLCRQPWEFLYRQKSQQFLALDPRTPVVCRLGEAPPGAELRPLRGRLRVLVADAAASDLDRRKRLATERQLAGLPVTVTHLAADDRQSLSRALAQRRSHVLHIVQPQGCTEDQPLPWSGAELAAIARTSPCLRLIVVTRPACDRAPVEESHSRLAAARALLAHGAAYHLVVEAHQRIDEEVAFTQACYRSLADGTSITEAVTAGRGASYAARCGESSALPVLFVGARERVRTPLSPLALSTIWTISALVTFSFAFNVWARTQQWKLEAFSLLPVGEIHTSGVAVYGIIWGAPALAILLAITRRYIDLHPARSWPNRLPIAFRIYPSLLGPTWRTFQATSFLLFLVLPMAAQIHFNWKLSEATVCDPKTCDGGCPPGCKEARATWSRVSWKEMAQRNYRFDPLNGRLNPLLIRRFIPFWQPLFFLLGDLALFAYFLLVCRRLFRWPAPVGRAAGERARHDPSAELPAIGRRRGQQDGETSMTLEYDDFTVRFTSLGERRFRAQVESPTGSGAEVIEGGLPQSSEFLEHGIFPSWQRGALRDLYAGTVGSVDPSAAGKILYQLLFHGTVAELFEGSLGFSAARRRGLRVILRFDPREPETELLSRLPWELLCRRNGDRDSFLALDPAITIVRHLDNVPRALQLEPLRETLRILVAIPDVTGLDWAREKQIVEKSLRRLPVEVSFLLQASRESLTRALAQERSHVLHYIGHGGFDPLARRGFLVLPQPDGRSQVSGRELAGLIGNTTSLRFVFLNSCQTAMATTASEPDAFSGVANALVLQGVPAVLAMQARIQDDDAIAFTQALYRSLATGSSLDEAVGAGRRVLRGRAGFATPVLFTRTRERILSLMSPTGLSTLWTLLGILAASLTFNVLSKSSGWNRVLPGLELRGVSRLGALPYGIALGVPVLALLLGVTHLYLRSRQRPDLIDRLPVAFGIALPLQDRARRMFQLAFLTLFLLLPLTAQVVFYGGISRLTVKDWGTTAHQTYGAWQMISWDVIRRANLGIVSPGDDPNSHETFYPLWEPVGFLLGELALFGYSGYVARQLVRGRSGAPSGSTATSCAT